MKGKVKFFNGGKGFGFVVAEDGKEYFVHISGVKEGVRLEDDMAVSFDVEEGDRGLKAVNVDLDNGQADAPATEEPEAEDAEETSEEEEQTE